MLSRHIRPRIRDNAVAALFHRRDVFIHSWAEACATFCALRIVISEQYEKAKVFDKNNKNMSSRVVVDEEDVDVDEATLLQYQNHVQMRKILRNAAFRIHVPRYILPMDINDRDHWAPLRVSNDHDDGHNAKGGARNSERRRRRASSDGMPPFTDEQFGKWINSTSNYHEASQVGGEGYVPLPAFINSFDTLMRYSMRLTQQTMGKRFSLASSSSSSSTSFSSTSARHRKIFSLKHQLIHHIGHSEAEPYRNLLKWLGTHAKYEQELVIASKRRISENYARVLYRSCVAHGGSTDAQFALSLVKDLSIGDLLVAGSGESDASLKQFEFSLRQCAGESSVIRGLSSRARVFWGGGGGGRGGSRSSSTATSSGSSSNLKQSSSSSSLFPPIIPGMEAPARYPHSLRPSDHHHASSASATSEEDFHFCAWHTPVEPLLPSVLLSPKDWRAIYRSCFDDDDDAQGQRTSSSSSSSSSSAPTRDEEYFDKKNIVSMYFSRRRFPRRRGLLSLRQQQQKSPSSSASLLVPPSVKDSLTEFDSQLLRRMSSDVGGYVAVVCPMMSAIEKSTNNNAADSDDATSSSSSAVSKMVLPKFTAGRLGKFPELVGAHDYSLANIWFEQFFESVEVTTQLRQKYLHFDSDSVMRSLFEPSYNYSNGENFDSEAATRTSIQLLVKDPFQLDYDFDTMENQQQEKEKERHSGDIHPPPQPPALGFTSSMVNRLLNAIYLVPEKMSGENGNNDGVGNDNNDNDSGPGRRRYTDSPPVLRLALFKCPPGLARTTGDKQLSNGGGGFASSSTSSTATSETEFLSQLNQRAKQQQRALNQKVENAKKTHTGATAATAATHKEKESLVEFENTWEFDQYLPKSGPSVPRHWADDLPTFSYLDQDHVARRRAEVQRREIHGKTPNYYSEILFPPHETRTSALVGSAEDSEMFATGADLSNELTSSGGFTAQDRNSIRQNFVSPTVTDAAQRLRDAQLRFGTVGAIFKSDLRQRQLSKAATKKQLARDLDRHMADEEFFNAKILPAGETTAMMYDEMKRIKVRKPNVIHKDRKTGLSYREDWK